MTVLIKKRYFCEIIFGEKYYIGGVDIFGESQNRKFLKNVDFSLSCDVPYKKIENADLFSFKINGKKFKLAIYTITEKLHIIAYFSFFGLSKSANANDEISRRKNKLILEEQAIENEKKKAAESDNIFYSDDFKRRIVISEKEGRIAALEQKITVNPDAEIDFPKDLNNPYSYLAWYEDCDGVSFYETMREAIDDVKLKLKI